MVFESAPPFPELPGLAGRKIVPARAENILCEPARRIFAWWHGVAATAQPTRADFDVIDHAGIADHLFLIERITDGFQLRLGGEEYTRMIPRKKGNQWREDSSDPVMRDYAIFLGVVSQARQPFLGTGRLELGERDWIDFESLTCPLAAAGDKSEGFLGCISQLG